MRKGFLASHWLQLAAQANRRRVPFLREFRKLGEVDSSDKGRLVSPVTLVANGFLGRSQSGWRNQYNEAESGNNMLAWSITNSDVFLDVIP